MKLSLREAQILSVLCDGLTNKEIAQQLAISPHTVRDHLKEIGQRHKLKGRAALTAAFLRTRTVHPFNVNDSSLSLGNGTAPLQM